MAFRRIIWKDRVRDASGKIVQEGTPLNAGNLNRIEEGIEEVVSQLAETTQQVTDLSAKKADKTEVNTLATDKADKSYVDQQIENVASGTPKGAYETLTALQTAYPTGATGIYVVSADGNWYYWNGTVWTSGGVYQSTLWQNALTTQDQVWSVI